MNTKIVKNTDGNRAYFYSCIKRIDFSA